MATALIVSDLALFGEGLRRVLAADGRIEVFGLARTGGEALAMGAARTPEVVLLDVSMPDVLDLVRELLALEPRPKVIALGLSDAAADVVPCAEAGISGYLCRDASLEDLVQTVQETLRGELRCSSHVAAALLERVSVLARGAASAAAVRLTLREREIARFLARGCTNKEIARDLGIEVGTVKNHVHSILEKLDASNRTEAAAKARELRLIPRLAGASAVLRVG